MRPAHAQFKTIVQNRSSIFSEKQEMRLSHFARTKSIAAAAAAAAAAGSSSSSSRQRVNSAAPPHVRTGFKPANKPACAQA
jgi:hypothetical protein